MILSAYSDQHEILSSILELHVPEGTFSVDPTYGRGGFYKKGIPEPLARYDLHPRDSSIQQGDCRHLPVEDGSLDSMIIDLPYLHAPGKESVMGNQFGGFRTQRDLWDCHLEAIVEAARVLKKGGTLTLKCQDIVEAGKQVFNHCEVYNIARSMGFTAIDLFVLVKNGKPIQGWNHSIQKHSRKNCSYFWVFRK